MANAILLNFSLVLGTTKSPLDDECSLVHDVIQNIHEAAVYDLISVLKTPTVLPC